MIARGAARLAFRNRALALAVASTSGVDLGASAVGYTRQSGSFVTDGYKVGHEVVPAGFTDTTPRLVIGVAASLLTIAGGLDTVQTSASGRTLAVGLPTARAWERVRLAPDPGRWFVEETFIPATKTLTTIAGNGGRLEETGLYTLRIYAVDELGSDGLDSVVDGLLALFTPGTTLSDGAGAQIRIREDLGPFAGEVSSVDGGWAVVPITIPWRAHSANTITA